MKDFLGWVIKDDSFVTRGTAPIEVTRWILYKDGKLITVEECFCSWVVAISEKIGQPTQRHLCESRIVADRVLLSVHAPTIKQIESALHTR